MNIFIIYFRTILFRLGFSVKPVLINWLITRRCNLACPYCEIGVANKKEIKETELNLDQIKKIVPQFKALGVRFVTFAGGEPLVYEDMLSVIKYCKGQGFIVGLVTNGILITEEVARQLAASGVDHIHISLDSPDNLQDEIRNFEGCFKRVDSAIRWLLKYKDIGGYHIGLGSVISAFNFDKVENLFSYAEKMGIDSVGLQPFFENQIRNKEMIDRFSITPEKIAYLQEKIKYFLKRYPHLIRSSYFFTNSIPKYFRDPKMKGTYCYGGGLTINIFPDGTLGACYYLCAQDAGSLREKKLLEIINTPAYRRLLERVRMRDCPTCWCPVDHDFNLLFRPLDILRSLRLLRVFKTGK